MRPVFTMDGESPLTTDSPNSGSSVNDQPTTAPSSVSLSIHRRLTEHRDRNHVSGASLDDRCWTLGPGHAGFNSQLTGLAEAVGLPVEDKITVLRSPWRFLPVSLIPKSNRVVSASEQLVESEPPRLVISCGRHAIAPALWLKRRFGNRTFAVHIQDPTIDPSHFDLVVAPDHDRIAGPNVYRSLGALHKVTSAKLDAAKRESSLIEPWNSNRTIVTVLIGGPNRYYDFGSLDQDRFIARLSRIANDDILLALIPSRRTPRDLITRCHEQFGRRHYVWDGEGSNPYFASLAMASCIVVTGDSVSMATEAAATSRPIFIEHLTESRRAVRFRRFHEQLQSRGIARPFDGELSTWKYTPPNDTAAVAQLIREKTGIRTSPLLNDSMPRN